jgi:hypothetical protein
MQDSNSERDFLELKNRLRIRWEISRFLIRALGSSMIVCFSLLFLDGFHLLGFKVDDGLLRWLLGGTVLQAVSLLTIFAREVWKR